MLINESHLEYIFDCNIWYLGKFGTFLFFVFVTKFELPTMAGSGQTVHFVGIYCGYYVLKATLVFIFGPNLKIIILASMKGQAEKNIEVSV